MAVVRGLLFPVIIAHIVAESNRNARSVRTGSRIKPEKIASVWLARHFDHLPTITRFENMSSPEASAFHSHLWPVERMARIFHDRFVFLSQILREFRSF
jgi:hypothetical protein